MVREVLYTPFELLAASPVILLQSSLSVVLWAARWATWRVRCLVRVTRGGVLPQRHVVLLRWLLAAHAFPGIIHASRFVWQSHYSIFARTRILR